MNDFEDQVAKCYSTWGETYYEEYYGENAPYPSVHTGLLRKLLKENKVKDVLDAGCGPASFLREIFKDGFNLWGFDLTPEMVTEGRRIFEKNNFPPENIWQGSILDKQAFIQPECAPKLYDATVCAGVLPHIPEDKEDEVFLNLYNSVKSGGLVALEARNQLFSLFTMNRYTYQFMVDELIRPKAWIEKNEGKQQLMKNAIEEMEQHFRMDLPPIRKGKKDEPGYDEVLSRTHNPIVLKQKFEDLGFQKVQLLFYHFHCLPPMFSNKEKSVFIAESLAMENPTDWRGHFMASAFFVVGVKP